jgi:hypothetical protein
MTNIRPRMPVTADLDYLRTSLCDLWPSRYDRHE